MPLSKHVLCFWRHDLDFDLCRKQRSYQRGLDKRSSGLFWAVWVAEKRTPNCHKYTTFWSGFFNFLWAKKNRIEKLHNNSFIKKNFFCPQKVEKNTLKSCPEKLKSIFFPYCQLSPNSPNRGIHVPKWGLLINCI